MKDFDVPKLSAIWQPLKNIAEIQGIQNMQMLDERARELYVHHLENFHSVVISIYIKFMLF